MDALFKPFKQQSKQFPTKTIEFVAAQDLDGVDDAPIPPPRGPNSHVPLSARGGDAAAHLLGKAQRPQGGGGAKELFREQDVVLRWSKIRRVGSGLQNLGNTCFMNSVLQCLLHTPPLAELLLSERALPGAPQPDGFDPVKMTRDLLHETLRSRQGHVAPRPHARTLRKVCRSFRPGRQEDAHEYLIGLLDAMHERSLAGAVPRPPPAVEFTSFVYRIFGGRMRSQVKCTACGFESNTYDPFLDLSLEISHAASVERALQRFTAGEVLDGSNKYRCPRERRGVRAEKRMTVEQAPPVLVIQLKRFEFSRSGRKVSKPVAFGEALDLSPAMSRRPVEPALYDLYGVLVHQGHSMHSGHYFCFVKGAAGEWHKCDDQRVCTTALRNVLAQSPYILFYTRRAPEAPAPEAPAQGRNAFGPTQQQPAAPRAPAAAGAAVAAAEEKPKRKQQQPQSLELGSLANGIAGVPVGGKKRKRPDPPATASQPVAAQASLAARRQQEDLPFGGTEPVGQDLQRQKRQQAQQREQEERQEERCSRERDERKTLAAAAAAAATTSGASSEAAAAAVATRAAKHAKRSEISPPLAPPSRARPTTAPMSPGSWGISLGRRGKRLEEQVLLAQMVRRGSAMVPSPMRQRHQSGPGGFSAAKQGRLGGAAAARAEPPVTRRRIARLADGAPNSAADASVDSAVDAPEWPPLRDALAAGHAPEAEPTAAAAPAPAHAPGKAGPVGVEDLLKATNGVTLGVPTWDSVEPGSKWQHDRLMRHDGARRRPLDEYDAEYDQGKLKKVRSTKREASGLDGAVFDAAYRAKRLPSSGKRQEHSRRQQRGGSGRGRAP